MSEVFHSAHFFFKPKLPIPPINGLPGDVLLCYSLAGSQRMHHHAIFESGDTGFIPTSNTGKQNNGVGITHQQKVVDIVTEKGNNGAV